MRFHCEPHMIGMESSPGISSSVHDALCSEDNYNPAAMFRAKLIGGRFLKQSAPSPSSITTTAKKQTSLKIVNIMRNDGARMLSMDQCISQ